MLWLKYSKKKSLLESWNIFQNVLDSSWDRQRKTTAARWWWSNALAASRSPSTPSTSPGRWPGRNRPAPSDGNRRRETPTDIRPTPTSRISERSTYPRPKTSTLLNPFYWSPIPSWTALRPGLLPQNTMTFPRSGVTILCREKWTRRIERISAEILSGNPRRRITWPIDETSFFRLRSIDSFRRRRIGNLIFRKLPVEAKRHFFLKCNWKIIFQISQMLSNIISKTL
jgi:hypothetical protein